jgi:hypothetical protein
MTKNEAVKQAAENAGVADNLDVMGADGHRTKIAIPNTIFRLTKHIDEWDAALANRYWCLAVCMGGGQKAASYPWMVRQTMIDKLKEFYKIKNISSINERPHTNRSYIETAVKELLAAGIIEEGTLHRMLDTTRNRNWKPSASSPTLSSDDEFKMPSRRYL